MLRGNKLNVASQQKLLTVPVARLSFRSFRSRMAAVTHEKEAPMFWTNFAQPQQFADLWLKSVKDQMARVEAMQKEVERLELQGFERTNEAIEESAKVARESCAYAQKLQCDWRKITLEAVKKSTEMFGVAS